MAAIHARSKGGAPPREWITADGAFESSPEFRRAHAFSRCPTVRLESVFSVDGPQKAEELQRAQALCDESHDADMQVMESKVHWHVFRICPMAERAARNVIRRLVEVH